MEDLKALIQKCEDDTRRLLSPGAAERLGNWRNHTQSLADLVAYVELLLWGGHCQNGKRIDQQDGLSLERIVLLYRPELFSDSDKEQAKETLGRKGFKIKEFVAWPPQPGAAFDPSYIVPIPEQAILTEVSTHGKSVTFKASFESNLHTYDFDAPSPQIAEKVVALFLDNTGKTVMQLGDLHINV